MKSILIVYDFYKPAKKGGGIITSLENLIPYISSTSKIYILTSAYDLGTKDMLPGIQPDVWTELSSNVSIYYASKGDRFTFRVRKQIEALSPDVIYLNGLFSKFVYIPLLALWRLGASCRIVIAPRGMVQEGALKVKPVKKKIYLSLLKLLLARMNVTWHATDSQESVDIGRAFGPAAKVILALDTPSLHFPEIKTIPKRKDEVDLVYLSLITKKKNLTLLLQSLIKIPTAIQVRLHVYGPIKDADYWEKCQVASKRLPNHVHFSYHGSISPEEVIPVLQRYHFLVLPSLGENFGHAIFESFVAGRPVIISNLTPWKDLQAKSAGWELPLDQHSFAVHVEKAARMDDAAFSKLCVGARDVAAGYLKENDFTIQYSFLFGP